MKKKLNTWLVGTAVAMVALSACQTAQVNNSSNRNPAFAKHKPDSNTVDNPDANSQPNDNGSSSDQSNGTPDNSGAQSEIVRISTINGQVATGHGPTIDVHPGDIVSISADVFNSTDGGFAAESRNVEEFSWSATDNSSDVCNASDSSDCLNQSNFQVTDYGVSYYVPYNAGSTITLSVTDVNSPNAGSDMIVLNNVAPITATPVIVASPENYPCGDFNQYCALAGQGRWVYIDGASYFVPYVNDPAWASVQPRLLDLGRRRWLDLGFVRSVGLVHGPLRLLGATTAFTAGSGLRSMTTFIVRRQ